MKNEKTNQEGGGMEQKNGSCDSCSVMTGSTEKPKCDSCPFMDIEDYQTITRGKNDNTR